MPVATSRRQLAALSGVAMLAVLASGPQAARADEVATEEAQRLGRAAAAATAEFDIYLPPRDQARLDRLLADLQDPGSPSYHKWLTPAEFGERFGPDAATLGRVRSFLAAHGMRMAGHDGPSVQVQASVGAIEAAFATRLSRGRFADGAEELVADAPLALSQELQRLGVRIPQFAATLRRHAHSRVATQAMPLNAKSPTGPYLTADLRQAYDFPDVTALSGKGVTIGILMQGAYKADDINAYFTQQGLTPPALSTVNINGGAAFSKNGSVETHLDIQQAAGMAPGAAVVLYNVKTLSDAALQAGLRRINADNTVDIVNMSFGEPEAAFAPKFNGGVDQRPQMQTFKALFAQGVAQGITFVASSGDDGSSQVITTAPVLSVSHPASDPNVTGVGGTNLVTVHNGIDTDSSYVRENANGDPYSAKSGGGWGSGGGISVTFPIPGYQTFLNKAATFRLVPDLALHMGGCPSTAKQPCGPDRSGDVVIIGGQSFGVIGTSASAPDIAGLFALKVAMARGTAAAPAGRLGNANPDIYAKLKAQIAGGPKVYFHTGIVGTNGAYKVAAPYDLVIGAGTVDARQFLGATGLPAAGNPGTTGNP